MSGEIRLSSTTVNAPDALALAIFHAERDGPHLDDEPDD
jgi:hypothetical protein